MRLALLLAALGTAIARPAAVSPSSSLAAARGGGFAGLHRIITSSDGPTTSIPIYQRLHRFRGGAVDGDEEYDDYDSDYDEEECDEEAIVATAKKLASSTKTVAQKRKAAAVKSKVKVAMAASAPKSKAVSKSGSGGGRSLYERFVPYIVRACLNPFTFLAMTKAYFVSLCDINYLKEEQSQTLRSALEEKARKQQPPSGSTKPKRKMKPGQAKTLSDLPQLSA